MNPEYKAHLQGRRDIPRENLKSLWESEAGEETVNDWLLETPLCQGPADGQATAVGHS